MDIKCSYKEMRAVVNLVPNNRNTNKHPETQIKLLAKIMDFQGWRHPIIVSKLSGKIVAGHGRLEAAKLNGWDECPIDIQDFENEAEEILFLESDNHIAELAEHDRSAMIDNLSELEMLDIDFELLGIKDFSFLKLDESFDDVGDSIEDNKSLKYILEVTFPNSMELSDVRDNLLSRGFIVKEK